MIPAMDDVTASSPASREYVHSFRRSIFAPERTYRLGTSGLEWRDNASSGAVAYADIVAVDEYKSKVWGALSAELPRRFDYVLDCRDGSKIALNSIHVVRFGVAENRAASCAAFVTELNTRIAAANPNAKFLNKLSWWYRLDTAAGRARYGLGHVLFKLIRYVDVDRAANFCAW